MKGTHLGEFEELVLLLVGSLHGNAYGVTIKNEIESKTNRRPSIGALHSALNRLDEKGFIQSEIGHGHEDRGGRRKKIYKLTESGREALVISHDLRHSLFQLIPNSSNL
ncbi:MAG: PadR family transcriptional regulator [Cyclobacteriaceae bacterium]